MTIMTVFELGPNIVLNRVFQCEKQFRLDFCTVLNWIGGIHYFLGFRTCFTFSLSMVKNVVFRFLSMFFMFFVFRRTLFVHSLCCCVCLVGVGGWGNGASFWVIVCVVRLADWHRLSRTSWLRISVENLLHQNVLQSGNPLPKLSGIFHHLPMILSPILNPILRKSKHGLQTVLPTAAAMKMNNTKKHNTRWGEHDIITTSIDVTSTRN